jgi:hypothetical protein
MAKRPRRARIGATSDTIHLVALTHDDRNQITTLCGYVEEGIWQGGTRLCENCEQTFRDLAAEMERLRPRIVQRA